LIISAVSQQYFGYKKDETDFFCWYLAGNQKWELFTFYFPMLVVNCISVIVFITTIIILRKTDDVRAHMQGKSEVESSIQPGLLTRLCLQLFGMFFVYFPDALQYMMIYYGGIAWTEAGSSYARFMFRSEGIVVSLMWLTNTRAYQGVSTELLGCTPHFEVNQGSTSAGSEHKPPYSVAMPPNAPNSKTPLVGGKEKGQVSDQVSNVTAANHGIQLVFHEAPNRLK
jgi:hypothetical protein